MTGWDIAANCALSAIIPLTGNLMLALLLSHVRRFLASPSAIRRTNQVAGALLIGVGIAIYAL